MDFVGQEALFKTINGWTPQTAPKTILLLGEEGCGKKTVVKYIANRLGLEFIDVCGGLTPERLIDWQQSPIRRLYQIDLTKLALDKDQNQFLKFIEEPSPAAYIALIAESEAGILPTVLNRCVKLRFAPYSVENLKKVKAFSNEALYLICRTPGKLKNASEKGLGEMQALCDAIVTKFDKAPYPNALSIVPRINYKDNYSKFDFCGFLDMLEDTAKKSYIESGSELAYKIYMHVAKRRDELGQNGRIAKEAFMTSLMDGLWRETR